MNSEISEVRQKIMPMAVQAQGFFEDFFEKLWLGNGGAAGE